MYEVLRKWEYLVAHIGRCATATEVCNLIEFIHRRAGFRQNRTAAGDKAPCIEITAALDRNGAVIRHFDVSIITNGTSLLAAASGKIPAAQADGAIDGNGRAFAHRQRPERLRRGSRPNRRRSIRVQRSCLIERNQKCNSSRNGIVSADRAVRSQRNLGLAVCLCIGNCLVQIIKRLSAGFKESSRFTCELRRNGAVAFNEQRSRCSCVDVFTIGNIVPAHELVPVRRGRHHLIGVQRTLRVAVFLGNGCSVYCISAVFSRQEGRCGSHVGYQCHIGQGDLSSSTGASGLDVYFNGFVCRQFLSKTGTRRNLRTSYLNRSTILLNGIVKRKGCCCRLLIRNFQCGIIGCIATCSACAGS